MCCQKKKLAYILLLVDEREMRIKKQQLPIQYVPREFLQLALHHVKKSEVSKMKKKKASAGDVSYR